MFTPNCRRKIEQIFLLKPNKIQGIIYIKYVDNINKNFIMKYLNIFSLIILERMFYGSLSHT